jgi:hypothetical protein
MRTVLVELVQGLSPSRHFAEIRLDVRTWFLVGAIRQLGFILVRPDGADWLNTLDAFGDHTSREDLKIWGSWNLVEGLRVVIILPCNG